MLSYLRVIFVIMRSVSNDGGEELRYKPCKVSSSPEGRIVTFLDMVVTVA